MNELVENIKKRILFQPVLESEWNKGGYVVIL